jgi:hypothetical protein
MKFAIMAFSILGLSHASSVQGLDTQKYEIVIRAVNALPAVRTDLKAWTVDFEILQGGNAKDRMHRQWPKGRVNVHSIAKSFHMTQQEVVGQTFTVSIAGSFPTFTDLIQVSHKDHSKSQSTCKS